jgi:1A family penicillin-binding protein
VTTVGATPPPRRRFRIGHRGAAVLVVVLIVAIAAIAPFARFAADVRALRERRAVGPAWVYPSRVYSDGVPLVSGGAMPPGYLRAELVARGYREVHPPVREPGTWSSAPGGMDLFLRGFLEARDPAGRGGPERVRLALSEGAIRSVARLGGRVGAVRPDLSHPPRLEPVPVALLTDGERVRRTWVPLERIPRVLRNAVVASEDRRFYRHFGLDLKSNFRALLTNARAGGVRQGASTITQQLARGLFLGRERTWARKLHEAALAVGLELLLSKDEILEMYLNSVYWGQSGAGGVAGVAEASRFYFDVPVESLRVVEAATLVGMIPAPNVISPFRNPALALARRNAVLADMAATHVLAPELAARARKWPLDVRHGPEPAERFPSYAGYVRDALGRALPPHASEQWGLSVFTTLDLVWQTDAESWLRAGLDDLERWSGRAPDPLEGAFVAIDPGTGAVRAVVGGRSAQVGEFNRATQARRQPGSAIKPLVYAAALDRSRSGPAFTPASTLPDERRAFDTPEGPWKPRNDDDIYHPGVTLAKALAKSINVATANLVEAIGADVAARYAERFGLGSVKAVPSIGLGTNEVTLLALTNAYAAFDNGGVRREASPLRAVVDANGRSLLAAPAKPVQVIPSETAALMTGLLEDVVIYGVSYPLRAQYGFTRPCGGKTGTTNDYNDAWFIGFTPDVVAGVWVGYDTPRSLGRPAAESALPVWAGIMTRLLDGFPARTFPSDAGLDLAWIDPWTGGLAAAGCPVMRVPFLPGTSPTRYCPGGHPPADSLDAPGAPSDSLSDAVGDSTRTPAP